VLPLLGLLRLGFAFDVRGASRVQPGPAILVSNHQSALDPFVTIAPTRWECAALAKVELFEHPVTGPLVRLMGQIPLRRGDDAATEWAIDMATRALASGVQVGLYPEGTRGPDARSLYRLHRRVLIPLLRADPDVAVHGVTITYDRGRLRRVAHVRISERLALDIPAMSDDEIVEVIRDTLVDLGGLTYVDRTASQAKRDAASGRHD
jgi:1-acyl-sn-glycerol-3-phosphate acyltransferase